MCICVPVQMLMVKAIGTIHKVCVFVVGWLIIGATFQSHLKKKISIMFRYFLKIEHGDFFSSLNRSDHNCMSVTALPPSI